MYSSNSIRVRSTVGAELVEVGWEQSLMAQQWRCSHELEQNFFHDTTTRMQSGKIEMRVSQNASVNMRGCDAMII